VRRTVRITLALSILLACAQSAFARPVTDCPLRDRPFGSDSPLVDLLLSPAAKAILDREAPGLFARLPPRFAGTTAPTFAAILTLKEASGMLGLNADAAARIEAALRSLPVTSADKVARCARYDDDRPSFVMPSGKPRILLFEKITGFRDGPSVDAAHAAFLAMGARKGWAIVTSDQGGAFAPAVLRKFDVVIWNNISGDVLTLSQRRAFQQWLEHGGAFVGVHGTAGDPVYFWDWYVDTLLGARFIGHPMAPQFQDARVVIEDRAHPAARGLPAEWVMKDEWYSFRPGARASGSHVIATLDEQSYSPVGMAGQNLRMGDHPIAWTRCIGKGRMFYSAIGHRPETYAEPNYVTMLESAVAWAAESGRAECARRR